MIGDKITDLLVEPIQKKVVDDKGLVSFYKCFEEFIKEKQEVHLKCFDESLGANYKLLTDSMKLQIEEMKEEYDNVNVEENGVKETTITLSNDKRRVQ